MSELAVALLLAALMSGPSPSKAGGVPGPVGAPAATAPARSSGAATAENAARPPQRKGKRGSDAGPELVRPAAAPVPVDAD